MAWILTGTTFRLSTDHEHVDNDDVAIGGGEAAGRGTSENSVVDALVNATTFALRAE